MKYKLILTLIFTLAQFSLLSQTEIELENSDFNHHTGFASGYFNDSTFQYENLINDDFEGNSFGFSCVQILLDASSGKGRASLKFQIPGKVRKVFLLSEEKALDKLEKRYLKDIGNTDSIVWIDFNINYDSSLYKTILIGGYSAFYFNFNNLGHKLQIHEMEKIPFRDDARIRLFGSDSLFFKGFLREDYFKNIEIVGVNKGRLNFQVIQYDIQVESEYGITIYKSFDTFLNNKICNLIIEDDSIEKFIFTNMLAYIDGRIFRLNDQVFFLSDKM